MIGNEEGSTLHQTMLSGMCSSDVLFGSAGCQVLGWVQGIRSEDGWAESSRSHPGAQGLVEET